MKFDFSALHGLASFRAKAFTLVLGLALGAAALSLGGCTCISADGTETYCPDPYSGQI